MTTLGLDFGTSNTAAGVFDGNRPVSIPLEPGKDTIPTAVFVDFADRQYIYGSAAATAMQEGLEGRFMRALKSILGTPIAQEPRMFLNERLTLIEIIARFLAEVKSRSEKATGQKFETALSGRPVKFHSQSPEKDAQAELDLRQAYEFAGFKDVSFLPEPEAAALAVEGDGTMLIVDIGGGTSDFTLCTRKGDQTDVITSRGLRLGGTDFDRTLSLAHAMPLFGMGADINAEIGSRKHPAPRALFHDLASWEKIAFVYDPALLRDVQKWIRLADHPVLFERLATILDLHLGHDVAYAVEAGKIAANETGEAQIELGVVERGLTAPLRDQILTQEFAAYADMIGEEALLTVQDAGLTPDKVDQVVFVGGSSLLSVVKQGLASRFTDSRLVYSEVFTAVVHGLAIAAK